MPGMQRKTILAACGSVLAAAMLISGSPPAGAATGTERRPASPSDAALSAALHRITEAGVPGALAEVRDDGVTWRGASGVADIDSKRPVRAHFRHRVGSVTKTFVATAVLQLVGEGRVALDAPVRRYLPNVAADGVTVRMLLNHTSGLGSYDLVLFATPEDFERHRYTTFDPWELVRIGMGMPRTGAPGARFAYSNTNYILAGLLLEKVTGRSYEHEITRRIFRPLGLRQTYFPGRATRIAGPHSKGYVPWYDDEARDFSVYNMSWARTTGALVSSTADLDRFYRALLGGRLLRPAELAQMRNTVPLDPAQPAAGGYGLGLYWLPMPCGAAWGHDGRIAGYGTLSLHSPDGRRQVTVAVNLTYPRAPGKPDPIDTAIGELAVAGLCGPAERTP